MQFIHYFKTTSTFNEVYNGNKYKKPWLSYTECGNTLTFNKPDYTKIPFTVEALGSGNITWKLDDKTVQYSKNGGSWETMDSETIISAVEGDEIQFKGTNTDYNGNTISATTRFNVKGNIMSLTNGDEFESANTVNASGFRGLFKECTYIISASDLKLPAITLASFCYGEMFSGCSSLTTAPDLPATTLATFCYRNMFTGCSRLTDAPELAATTLTGGCYSFMFQDCTSLTTAPELPATTLTSYCYIDMFKGCTSLNYIKCLATNIPKSSCTSGWVEGVSASGTFIKSPSMTAWTTGKSGIPSGWTVQDDV